MVEYREIGSGTTSSDAIDVESPEVQPQEPIQNSKGNVPVTQTTAPVAQPVTVSPRAVSGGGKKLWLLIGGIVIVAVILIGGGIFAFMSFTGEDSNSQQNTGPQGTIPLNEDQEGPPETGDSLTPTQEAQGSSVDVSASFVELSCEPDMIIATIEVTSGSLGGGTFSVSSSLGEVDFTKARTMEVGSLETFNLLLEPETVDISTAVVGFSTTDVEGKTLSFGEISCLA